MLTEILISVVILKISQKQGKITCLIRKDQQRRRENEEKLTSSVQRNSLDVQSFPMGWMANW